MFLSQLTFVRNLFRKNGYLENFIDRCLNFFLNRVHALKEKVL